MISENIEKLIVAKRSLETLLSRVKESETRNVYISRLMQLDLEYILKFLDEWIHSRKGVGNEQNGNPRKI